MPKELTAEYAKALYDLALNARKTNSSVQAINVLRRLVEMGDPFYTVFALFNLAQCYDNLDHRDLETEVLKSVISLPKEQQLLMNPGWIALCYQRLGELKTAAEIHGEVLKLVPNDTNTIAAIAELSILQGNLEDAETWARMLRERAEPNYQILGRIIAAFVLALRNKDSESASELFWVGQFIISSGSISPGMWDYSDLQPLTAKLGANSPAATLLLETLTGRRPVPEFIEAWKKMAIAV